MKTIINSGHARIGIRQMAQEVEAVPDARVIAPYRGESWEELIRSSHTVSGADLEKGDVLIGIPFVVVQITIRPGDYKNGKTGVVHPYASLNVITGSESEFERAVRRKRITQEQASAVDPMEQLVFNEAGTGVYRQCLAYLEELGEITFPEGAGVGVPFGDSRYDTLPASWDFPGPNTTVAFDIEGNSIVASTVRLHAPRGLRVSEYENEYTKEGRTRYFA